MVSPNFTMQERLGIFDHAAFSGTGRSSSCTAARRMGILQKSGVNLRACRRGKGGGGKTDLRPMRAWSWEPAESTALGVS